MVEIRPAAAQELTRLLHRHRTQAANQATGSTPIAQLTLEPGGCADWTYRLTVAADIDQPTTAVAHNGIDLAIPTAQLDLLKDLVIDYSEDLMGGGFRFINPLAQSTCGCGNAFALSADSPVTQDCTAAHLPTP
ncbi:MAG: HesB/IscA family protein [Nodosilinea sp.]